LGPKQATSVDLPCTSAVPGVLLASTAPFSVRITRLQALLVFCVIISEKYRRGSTSEIDRRDQTNQGKGLRALRRPTNFPGVLRAKKPSTASPGVFDLAASARQYLEGMFALHLVSQTCRHSSVCPYQVFWGGRVLEAAPFYNFSHSTQTTHRSAYTTQDKEPAHTIQGHGIGHRKFDRPQHHPT